MIKKALPLLFSLLALNAAAQHISVDKPSIDCGISPYEMPVTATYDITNTGKKPLTIEKVRVSCGCIAADYPKEPIAPGKKATLKLTYDARQLGRFEKSAGIYTNASDKPLYLTMKGVVRSDIKDYSGIYPYKVGTMRSSMIDIEFDDVNKGDNPVKEIFLVNLGTESLTPNLLHMPPYLTALASPETLRPGQTGKLTVMLNSEKLRDYGLTQTTVYLAGKLGDKISPESEMTVSAVLLHGFDQITKATKQYAPKMVLSTKDISINFNGKKKKTEKITITNNGRTALKITSLQMFTQGLQIKLNKSELEPGEKATLKVTAMHDIIKKVRTKPRILMITNDPDNAKVIINVNAK